MNYMPDCQLKEPFADPAVLRPGKRPHGMRPSSRFHSLDLRRARG
jgi:hypothetical protein